MRCVVRWPVVVMLGVVLMPGWGCDRSRGGVAAPVAPAPPPLPPPDGPTGPGGMRVLGHWDFGQTFDNAVSGGNLYLGAGEQVRIYDISTAANLAGLNWRQTDAFPGRPSDCGTFKEGTPPVKILHTGGFIGGYFVGCLQIDGDYLYIGNERYFLVAYVANPSEARIVGRLDLPDVRDIMVNGATAYAAAGDAVHVIDISDKARPTALRTLTGFDFPRRMDLSGNYLYVGDQGRLVILDVSSPTNPTVAGTYAGGGPLYSGVAVNGNHAFVVEYYTRLRVIDVSNPTSPVAVGTTLAGNYNDVTIFGMYAVVSDRYQGFDIVNISNPLGISRVSEVQVMPGYNEGVTAAALPYGNYVFHSTNTQGLGIVNITNVASPTREVTVMTPAGGDAIDVSGNYAYIGGHNVGVWVVDVSDPANPREVALVSNVGRNTGVKVRGNYVYVAGAWSELSVIDISDPANPRLVVLDYPGSNTGPYVVDGNYLHHGGLTVYDISSPTSPSIVFSGSLGFGSPFGGSVSALYRDRYLVGGGSNGLFVVDVSVKTNPQVVGRYAGVNLATGTYSADVKVSGDVAYAAAGNDLVAIDISDVSNPVLLGRVSVGGAEGIAIHGNVAFVLPSWYRAGFDAVDISDPRNMRVIYTFDVGGNRYESDIVEHNGLLYTNNGHIVYPGAP